jgi:hypothetical protein
MKNIHVLPTNKPSRLYLDRGKLWIDNLVYGSNNQNIYITNDEEIKEGDWYLNNGHLLKCAELKIRSSCKKIILTTDQDLIKDGVQAIDDTFLEWFVKNPSCEEVEVVTDAYTMQEIFELKLQNGVFKYKIIIPKEEPKQETLEQIDQNNPVTRGSTALVYKQETLEEVAHKMLDDYGIKSMGQSIGVLEVKKLMVKIAKWQQERSYSEEEAGELVYNIIGEYGKHYGIMIDGAKLNELFEQFKKK